MENSGYQKGYADLAVLNSTLTNPKKGDTYSVVLDGKLQKVTLVDFIDNKNTGYQGYLYACENNKYYIVHSGSQSLNPADKPLVPGNRDEAVKDYCDNVLDALKTGQPQSQFNDAYSFLKGSIDKYGRNMIQIGQSLGGYHSETLGALNGFKDIQTYTFNAVGAASSIEAIMEFARQHPEYNIELSGNYSNIQNYRYGNEFVTKIAPHFGEMYSAPNCSENGAIDDLHNMEMYTKNGETLVFKHDENFNTIIGYLSEHPEVKLSFQIMNGELQILLSPTHTIDPGLLKEILDTIGGMLQDFIDNQALKGYVSMDEMLYEIKPGDTIWGICDKYDIDMEELLKLNPWLRDRMSEDGKHILIKPDEKLRLPVKDSMLAGGNRPTFDVPFDEAAGAGTPGADPILVDLNGDGKIETTTVEDGINFDHQKDGFAEKTSWVSKKDGVLAIDKNNNGIIDDGSEIFGDNYLKNDGKKATSGFDALKDLDSNNDGIISAEDSEFNNIKILKGDGSLISLEEAGIVSINLNSNSVNTIDENGNILVSQGSFVKNDGSVGNLGDFNLIVDKMMSDEVNKVEVSEDVALLPDIRSLGYVHSLHQAIMRDESGELKQLVENFIAANDETNRKELLRQILYKWTGANKVTVASGGNDSIVGLNKVYDISYYLNGNNNQRVA